MPFTVWKHAEKYKHRKKIVFTMTSGDLVTAVGKNPSIDSKKHSLEPT